MNEAELSQVLLEGLVELEQQGELVITHVVPLELAERLRSKVIERWAQAFVEAPPHEVVIANCVQWATAHVQSMFGVPYPQALLAVERFIEDRRAERTLVDLADLLAHQGNQEIGMGAYYCVHLGRGEYYDSGYLAWRKGAWRGDR